MSKHKPGLHKEISSIFDGVPVAGKQDRQQDNKPGLRRIGSACQQEPVTAVAAAPTAVLEMKEEAKVEAPPQIAQIGKPAKTETPAEPVVKIIKELPVAKKESFISKKIAAFKEMLAAATPKQKATYVAVPVLAVVFILVLANSFKTMSGNKPKITPVAATVVTAQSDVKIDWKIPDPFPSNLRDPMAPVQSLTLESDQTVLQVSGILFSLEKSQAVVNGQIVEKGDIINGTEVVDITRDNVMFKKDEKTWIQKVGIL